MLKRTITGVLLIGTVVAAILLSYFVSPIFLDIYILVWAAIAMVEMYRCFSTAGYHIHKLPIAFALLLTYPVFYLMQHYLGLGVQGILIVFVTAVSVELAMFTLGNQERNKLSDLSSNVFILVYPMLILSIAWIVNAKYCGLFAILFAIFVPLGADTFAYFSGSLIGGKKLCPAISPKKTVAGAIGGLFGSMLISICFWMFFEYFNVLPAIGYKFFISHDVVGWEWMTALIYAAIGLVGGVVAELGDLAASRIKRELGIKDYGKIFPGHGGAMDRLDSIMSGLITVFIAFTAIYGF